MASPCRAKPALLRGLRPLVATQQQLAATQKILLSACSEPCIYCDIWKLATLIASHSPLSARYNLTTGTPTNSPVSSAPSSPVASSPIAQSPTPYASIISASKRIEAQFQTQRSQLNSILSICTVSGVDTTEGLRLAHDRVATAVEDLLDQEEDLEEELLRDLQEQQYDYSYNYGPQYAYSSASAVYGYSHERRPSMVHVTH
ncbi:uncharacterized protein A1O5_11593 [Cladophialophora psammophila CBS 110553]|uniref:Uncharacterized protein n=1 Tax=Cladophialophora psammophila CBS 110553 TaxID=1182543 RepID=W9W5C4_9EURO|nr:uncharacterized protein A1O5_11593 [Cladophialophora psammophila CBS 110553]EXJ63272.1 hypothetical protein A1O5_11593 [Cladophialophora psammophila CBS 110553]